MAKAHKAVSSARLLLNTGDIDGACSRAYYGMFDAAKAAVLASQPQIDTTFAKTHGGLISTFGQTLVKTGVLPVEMGRSLNRASEIRLIADYSGDLVTAEKADWVVAQAERFVIDIQHFLGS